MALAKFPIALAIRSGSSGAAPSHKDCACTDREGCLASVNANNNRTSTFPPVPTTKILAIGTVVAPLTPEQRKTIMTREVPATAQLYLAGKIDQWYVRQDNKGVDFLLNLDSIDKAHEMLEQLPLGQAHLMTFELIPLGPLSPLHVLLDHQ